MFSYSTDAVLCPQSSSRCRHRGAIPDGGETPGGKEGISPIPQYFGSSFFFPRPCCMRAYTYKRVCVSLSLWLSMPHLFTPKVTSVHDVDWAHIPRHFNGLLSCWLGKTNTNFPIRFSSKCGKRTTSQAAVGKKHVEEKTTRC